MIRFQCPACRSVLQVSPQLTGRVVLCSHCRTQLRIPAGEPRRQGPPPLPSPPLPTPAPRPVVRRSRPPRRRPVGLIVGLSAGLLLLATLAAGAVYLLTFRPRPTVVVEASAGARVQPVEKAPVVEQPPPKEDRSAPVTPPPVQSPVTAAPAPAPPDRGKPPPAEDALVARLLETVNRVRAAENVPALGLHPEHSAGCLAHARYLAAHLADRPDLDRHDQQADLAGASDAGKAAARAASVTTGDPAETLRAWLLAPAHRAVLLAPDLRSVGIGLARTDDGRRVGVFDWTRGGEAVPPSGDGEPVLYPVPGQRDVPLYFPGNEVPDPLPKAKDKLAGFPVTAIFPAAVRVPDARAWLEDESGQDVPVWFSSPSRPANERFTRTQQNTVCLFAREPLRPGMRYLVRLEGRVGQTDWARAWSFTTRAPDVLGRHIYQRACERLNHFRQAAGLNPVTLDDDLMRACRGHAAYLARHLDRVPDLDPNVPSPELPGYTAEAAAIANRSALRFGGGVGPADAIDWLMDSVLNRHLALNPTMTTVGMGASLHAPRGWMWVLHLPPLRRDGDGPLAVLYPGSGQRDVPLALGREVGAMLPDQPKDTVAGFAVSAAFFPRRRVGEAAGELTDADDQAVACWLSTPDKPLPGTGSYRQILLIPKQPLRPATAYTATMSATVDGKPWQQSWRFTTTDPLRYRRERTVAALEQVNAVRRLADLPPVELDETLSRGCQAHADYVVRHLDHPSVQGLGIHEEDAKLPGFSKAGQRAGQNGVIAILSDPADAVDGWMATLYHRIPLLDPALKRVGYGQTLHPFRGWVTVLDSGSGK